GRVREAEIVAERERVDLDVAGLSGWMADTLRVLREAELLSGEHDPRRRQRPERGRAERRTEDVALRDRRARTRGGLRDRRPHVADGVEDLGRTYDEVDRERSGERRGGCRADLQHVRAPGRDREDDRRLQAAGIVVAGEQEGRSRTSCAG